MIRATFLPSRWGGQQQDGSEKTGSYPNWFNRHTTAVLQSLSSQACKRPIHTIVFAAFLASTAYISLLESSLFDQTRSAIGKTDFDALLEGSKRLRAGKETDWSWQTEDFNSVHAVETDPAHDLALLTLVFPDSSPSSPQSAPPSHHVPVPAGSSAKALPVSPNPFSTITRDTSMVYSVLFGEASKFLLSVQEIPAVEDDLRVRHNGHNDTLEERKWIMKAVKSAPSGNKSLWDRAQDSWSAFLDVLQNAATIDIVIMVLGYLAMHLTFVSVFVSMRRLGSRFWLATTVLFSSVFAFLFGLMVTMWMGVPMNLVLLSEGLPFLVVTIGFEKPIALTKAVLSAALDDGRNNRKQGSKQGKQQSFRIYEVVQTAVKERGFDIVRDYCIEIAILSAGAASGIHGGLRQFCFLAAWILFFDCILLFTFYTAILSIKLEINRIKRHVALRMALEDDGISKRVAENIATSSDWPGLSSTEMEVAKLQEHTILGGRVGIPRFKVLMVGSFILVTVINLLSVQLRTSGAATARALLGMSRAVDPTAFDPFRFAGNGLSEILRTAQAKGLPVVVTVFNPIKYELQFPSIHYASAAPNLTGLSDEMGGASLEGVGGRVVEGMLKSLEDPVLSKWIIIALALSLAFNGYLFNAARWTLKEPHPPLPPPKANEVQLPPSDASSPVGEGESFANGHPRSSIDNRLKSRSDTPISNGHLERPSDRMNPIEYQQLDMTRLDAQLAKAFTERSYEDTVQMLKDKKAAQLFDEELVTLAVKGKLPGYALEKTLDDKERAVKIRRALVSRTHATRETSSLLESSGLPYKGYDYDRVFGACCENVIGYLPLPIGVAGPLCIDGQNYFLPMATTEGVLVASTSRGCKAINAGGGATTVVTGDGMTRGPCVYFETLKRAGAAKLWLDSPEGHKVMRDAFNSTSRFARLQTMKCAIAGTYLFIRFKTTTGDAMGMNMISKGVEHALTVMSTEAGFDDMSVVSISGNYCIDKKPSAINWIDGRGKSVVAEAIIPGDIVKSVLKSDVDNLVELNSAKNHIGSAMAGSIGGMNAHAANIITAMFLATGQDPAQNVESSNCITVMKNLRGNLQISVSMPCIEVGTLGGGTILEPQGAMLDLLGVRGSHPTNPGDNARQLARIMAAAVLAGELSLCSALAAGHLVKAHMAHNRSGQPSRAVTPQPGKENPSRGPARIDTQLPTSLSMTSIKDISNKNDR